MYATATAIWLDTFFAGYDHFFLSILHAIATKLGVILTPLMRLVTFLGEKGIIFFLLALVFMLCADRRDLGVCIFGAVCCGALITNIILKDNVARIRPFEAVAEYNDWWTFLGSPAEDGFSFPSGHVTACAAGMTAISLMRGKKWVVPSVVIVLVMGISRNYLMAHYPSDVLFAAIIGVFSGAVAWLITQLIFRFLNQRANNAVCATILDFDIRDVLPFELPSLPVKKGGVKEAFSAHRSAPTRKAAPARTSAAVKEPDADDDVKTYTGSRRQAGGEAVPARSGGSHAIVREGEAQPPVRKTAPSRTASAVGRHAIVRESESSGRRARASLPGAYKGKHEN